MCVFVETLVTVPLRYRVRGRRALARLPPSKKAVLRVPTPLTFFGGASEVSYLRWELFPGRLAMRLLHLKYLRIDSCALAKRCSGSQVKVPSHLTLYYNVFVLLLTLCAEIASIKYSPSAPGSCLRGARL